MSEQNTVDKSAGRLSEEEERRLQEIIPSMRVMPYWQPGNSKRLDKAVRLYCEGAVACDVEGVFHVQGSDEADSYTIARTCPCAYSQGRDDRWCSHRIAVALFRKLYPGYADDIPMDPDDEYALTDDEGRGAPATTVAEIALDRWQEGMAHLRATRAQEPEKDQDMTQESSHVPASDAERDVDGYMPKTTPSKSATGPLLPAMLTSRSITAIIADLSRPLSDACVAKKTVKGTTIRYLHWQTVARLLDAYAPGWNGEVTRLEQQGGMVRVTYRIYVSCAEGVVWREATGEDDEWGAEEDNRFGNPSANAQANAFKRAAALLGVGQWLYDKPADDKDQTARGLADYFQQEKQAALTDLGKTLVAKGMARKGALDWIKTKAGVTSIDQIPIVAIKTMLSHVIESPEVCDDLQGYPDGWLTDVEKRRLAAQREYNMEA